MSPAVSLFLIMCCHIMRLANPTDRTFCARTGRKARYHHQTQFTFIIDICVALAPVTVRQLTPQEYGTVSWSSCLL